MKRFHIWLFRKLFWVQKTLPIRRQHKIRLDVQRLEQKDLLSNVIIHGSLPYIVGAKPGQSPVISEYDSATGSLLASYMAYDSSFKGGVRVALADLNGDGVPDLIAAPGPGMAPIIKVFDGATGNLLSSFDAFAPGFLGGVTVDAGNIGEGRMGIIVGADAGAGPHVETFTLNGTLVDSFYAFSPSFRGGLSVALGISPLGQAEAIVGSGAGAAPSIKVFDLGTNSVIQTLSPYSPGYMGGLQVAAGDLNKDGTTDILVSPKNAPELHIQGYDGKTGNLLENFNASGFDAGSSGTVGFAQLTSSVPAITIAGYRNGAAEEQIYNGVPQTNQAVPTLVSTFPPVAATPLLTPGVPPPKPICIQPVSLPNTVSAPRVVPIGDCTPDQVTTTSCGSDTLVTESAGASDIPSGASVGGGDNVATGFISMNSTDLSSNGFGSDWGLTRSWTNNVLVVAGDYFGIGWTVSQNPYLLQAAGGNSIVVVTNGNDFQTFDLQTGGSYTERNFGRSNLTYNSSTNLYTFVDEFNDVIRFTGFGSSAPTAEQGQFQSETDPAGVTTQVTSETSSGTIGEIQRTVGSGSSAITESYLYSYLGSGDPNAGLVSSVVERTKVGSGSWTTVRQAIYTYYNGTEAYGNLNDLKLAQIEDGSGNVLDTSYYRYYGASDPNGPQQGLEYVLNSDSYARLAAAYSNPTTVSNTVLSGFADEYYQYNSNFQVSEAVTQGSGCTSCSSGFGTDTFTYSTSSNAAGYNSWHMKTVETLSDGNTQTTYSNVYDEPMLSVYQDTTSGLKWCTYTRYDSSGRAILTANPSAVTGYSESYADLVNFTGGSSSYISSTNGLITNYNFATSTTASGTTAGNILGYLMSTSIQQGLSGTTIPQSAMTYYDKVVSGNDTAFEATSTQYRNTNGTGAETTSYSYTWQGSTAQVASETISLPVISSAENGPGTADVSTTVYDSIGRPVWTKDADGYINYTAYDTLTGAVITQITDVNTSLTGEFVNLPSGWSTPTGGGLNLITSFVVDALGRTTKVTHPNGDIDYTVYDDPDHEVRTYIGWNSTTNTASEPTQVIREDRSHSYTETLTMSATPAVSGGVPTGTEAISNVQSLTRDITNDANQVVEEDQYFSLSGASYSTSTYLGTSGTNYYATQYFYGHRGWLEKTVDPTGTIIRTVYDGLGRVVSTWVGTNDTPASGYWSPTNNTSPSNMVETASYVYDNGGVGDGNKTAMILYPGGGTANRETDTYYDWRDRAVAVKEGVQTSESTTVHRPIYYTTYNNLDEAIEVQHFDGDGVSITSTGGVPNTPSASLLRAETQTFYDDQGRVYLTETFDVDPSTGSVSTSSLNTNTYYDHRGDAIETSSPGGLVEKEVYDGAGRNTVDYTTDGGGGNSWAAASSVASDTVLDQKEYTHDANGNVILTVDRQRFDSATGTGALGSPTSGIGARVYYDASYYDMADRAIADVNVGTNGGTAYTRPSSVPSSSSTVLVTTTSYDAAGNVLDVVDPLGLDTRNYYDMLGRTTETIQDYTNGIPTNETNKTTEYTYNAVGMTSETAVAASGNNETTAWVYGVVGTGTPGSYLYSNDLVGITEYPGPTGAPSTTQEEITNYDALGEKISFQDRNGNEHTYSYDVLGRQTADAIVQLGTGVDGTIREHTIAYDTQGNPYLFTSYSTSSGGTIVNQVEDVYNGLDQLIGEYQSHSGAVVTGTTPEIQYSYSEMAGGANNSRLTSMTYADGYTINYNYSSGLNNTISRLSSLSDSSGTLESYTYLGLDTIVVRDLNQAGIELTYIKESGESNGSAGDQYTGLDSFGRVIDQRWVNSSGTAVDRIQYGYDADGNVLYENNLLNSAESEIFTYDALNQTSSYAQGTLNGTKTGISGTPSATQSWTYDSFGNMTNVTTNGTGQTRTANTQNEYTAVGSATPGYDSNGNTTTDENSNQYVYDAWNMLVAVKNSSGSTIASYVNDALGRQIQAIVSGTTTDRYFSAQWQLIEEYQGSTETDRYVWSPTYIDAMISRDTSTGSGTLNLRIYALQNADYDTTSLVNTFGSVLERYTYSPFGVVSYLNSSWGSLSGSAYGWKFLHQGGELEAGGLSSFRNRMYSPTLERWMQNDPIEFLSGDNNFYMFCNNNVIKSIDPFGLSDLTLAEARKLINLFLNNRTDLTLAELEAKVGKNNIEIMIEKYCNAIEKQPGVTDFNKWRILRLTDPNAPRLPGNGSFPDFAARERVVKIVMRFCRCAGALALIGGIIYIAYEGNENSQPTGVVPPGSVLIDTLPGAKWTVQIWLTPGGQKIRVRVDANGNQVVGIK